MSSTKQYWEAKLADYNKQDWSDQPTFFAQQAIKYFPETGDLLELGAGLAQDSAWFASKGYKVTSTDQIERHPVRGVHMQKNDLLEKLPFPDESFDIVYSHLALHYFSLGRTKALFEEIYDILRPDGVFAFLVNSTHDPEVNEGEEIEANFRNIKGISKRYFDISTTQELTKRFSKVVLDDKGSSHKDNAKGVANLIRFIGTKV